MEFLELPQDIIWDGNQSPMLSPSHLSNASTEQVLIFEDSFANELIPNDDDLMKTMEVEEEVLVFSQDEFDQLLEIQKEIFNNMDEEEALPNDQWLDQPINVPVDEYVPVQDARIFPVKNTAQLLNEFNQVYDAVELTHLTPPETPPHSPPQTLQVYLNQSKNQFYSPPTQTYQHGINQLCQSFKTEEEKPMPIAYAPPQPVCNTQQQQQFPTILEQAIHLVQQASPTIEYADNIEDAMAEVEALVRSRAEDFAESSIDDDSSICDSSTCFSPRSDASSPRSESTSDSDWTQKSSLAIGAALKAKQKRKPRKNRRSLEDRQSRKKEQNKTAANRYRLKKKAEIEILLDEERELQTQNDKLQKQYDEVSREASYIKRLLRAAFEAKGML